MMEISKKYNMLPDELARDLMYYEDKYFCFDEPVPFCGLYLHPVKLREYYDFLSTTDCLTIDKNADIEGIPLSNLDYIIKKITSKEQGAIWSYKFSRLLEMVFQIQNGMICNKCNQTISFLEYFNMINLAKQEQKEEVVCPLCGEVPQELRELIRYVNETAGSKRKKIIINDTYEITAKDFDRFRKIVLFQNLPDYKDDSMVDPSLREDYNERQRLLSKKSGKASLEKQIVAVSTQTNYKLEELYDFTMRKFFMLLGTMDDAIEYKILRTGMMSGLVRTEGEFEHWIFKKEKDIYGDAYITPDEVKSKLGET